MAKTQNTGYLVIDCKGQELGETPITIPGVYNRMKKANKVCMLQNFVSDSVQGSILFTPSKLGSEYLGAFLEGAGQGDAIIGLLTFSSDDKLTFATATPSPDIPASLYKHEIKFNSVETSTAKLEIHLYNTVSTPYTSMTEVTDYLKRSVSNIGKVYEPVVNYYTEGSAGDPDWIMPKSIVLSIAAGIVSGIVVVGIKWDHTNTSFTKFSYAVNTTQSVTDVVTKV